MNANHRIVNATSSPALLLAGNTAPNIMNNFDNEDFIFNCPYQFKDRFDPRDDYYKYKEDITPDPVRGLAMRQTNIIPDVISCEFRWITAARRVIGASNRIWSGSSSTCGSANMKPAATRRPTRMALLRC